MTDIFCRFHVNDTGWDSIGESLRSVCCRAYECADWNHPCTITFYLDGVECWNHLSGKELRRILKTALGIENGHDLNDWFDWQSDEEEIEDILAKFLVEDLYDSHEEWVAHIEGEA